jgi:ABC-type polysaccharide/polyol phosphate transport system ATPase subunit
VSSIRAENVGVRFLFDRQRNVVPPTIARLRRRGSETWGLHEVSFTIHAGDGVALIGASGSGKTTLLRTMAGVLHPDSGRLEVNGRVASLLSIEAGLLPVLSGRENAQLLGVLAGLSRRQTRAALEDVKARSGLEESFERPVTSFSQGMRARLGFSVADAINPEILLLDEVHEALDHEFRAVVERRAKEILDGGGIVVAAGHDHPMLERLCNRAFLMRAGVLQDDGEFDAVQRRYLADGAMSSSP